MQTPNTTNLCSKVFNHFELSVKVVCNQTRALQLWQSGLLAQSTKKPSSYPNKNEMMQT